MSAPSRVLRIGVVLSSLTLLSAYVWHSHVTPNTPPPDPLGMSTLELTQKPEPELKSDLRIISSKAINQPIFSVRKTERTSTSLQMIFSSSKSGIVRLPTPSFSINGDQTTFDLFGNSNPPAPPP